MYISPDFEESVRFEHRFWLQILGDHARFILNTLSPNEMEKIERTKTFINTFDRYLDKARENLTGPALDALTEEAFRLTKKFRIFKLEILKEHLVGKVEINLPPTFINHMVNELDEYLNILNCFLSNVYPEAPAIHHHILWLLDGVGHANSINSNLDDVEKDLKKKSKEFAKHFDALHMKAMEFAGYMRTNLSKFPALSRLNKQAELEMLLFMNFLKELEDLRLDKEALGIIQPLMLDHMFREECYYLTKLSQVSEVKGPDCNPAKPRIEE
ncbi:DUF2935 domain-containing protein [Clostridium rhizosphaerae]|uniref:DUF2935 domain-containing protein n=1 Tax=Clostridium rhizosphaerae TaxID=2803861 RepID=UPI001FAFDF31|nr:DUF2935 domain-containing protein [Clostridium rhizosphaerae]